MVIILNYAWNKKILITFPVYFWIVNIKQQSKI